jgi:hypothetical protein
MVAKRKLPDDPHPDTEDRFNRLLEQMATPAKQVEQPSEEDKTSDEERAYRQPRKGLMLRRACYRPCEMSGPAQQARQSVR